MYLSKVIGKMVENFLRPISSKHSIREAVITLFLSQPIPNANELKNQLGGALKSSFQAMQDVRHFGFQVQINQKDGGVKHAESIDNNAGFHLVNTVDGKTTHVLQAINDTNRIFISYHSFAYIRWENFFPEFIEHLKVLSNLTTGLSVRAVSIHYIDEFKWIADTQIDPTIIFNKESPYISRVLLEPSIKSETNYLIEKIEGDFKYFERLSVKTDNKSLKNIEISHSTISELQEPKLLSSLLSNDYIYFSNIITSLHKYNKLILEDILLDEVKKLINLPSKAVK